MPSLFCAAFTICLLLFAGLPSRTLASPASPVRNVRVFVQLVGSPLALDTNLKVRSRETRFRSRIDPTLQESKAYAHALQRYQDRELRFIRSHGISITVDRQFQLLFNGFSALVPSDQVTRLRHLANVQLVAHMHRPVLLDTGSLALVHAAPAWVRVGGSAQAGKGMIIANIDSGIEISNPCFSDTGYQYPPAYAGQPRFDNPQNKALTNKKVVGARAFGPDQGKQYSAADVGGHGTFTAAIEACNFNTPTPIGAPLSGVAPAAYLLNYNIFPKGAENSAYDAVLPALESALYDGADVVNMSIGFPGGGGDPKLNPDLMAVKAAVKGGITVVVSAGNSGPTTQTVTSPASAPESIAVGAVSNSESIFASIAVSGPGSIPSTLTRLRAREFDKPWSATIGPAPVGYVGYGRKPGDDPKAESLDEFSGQDLHGKIALIERGSDTGSPIFFETKLKNAEQAGATAAIVFDNRDEVSLPSITQGKTTIRAMFISQADGKALLAWLHEHPDATVTMNSQETVQPQPGGILTDFSSRGFGAGYDIKPDMVGPGENIYSAVESLVPGGELYNPKGFASADGTSFSAPHVTGAAALVLQQHPKWTPDMVKSALMNTASSEVYLDVSKSSTPTVTQVGAGMLDVQAALAATALVSPASVSFGELNVGSGAVQQTVQLALNDANGGSGTWNVTVQQWHGTSGLSVSTPTTINLAANGRTMLPVTASAGVTAQNGEYDGTVTLAKGTETLHVPYFVRVADQTVKPGSVLLVDATTSRYQPSAPEQPIAHIDVSKYYTETLAALGKSYTYWDEARLGVPTLEDMKHAAAVIYFTGANLNQWSPPNSNSEALIPPLDSADISVIHSYVDAGGKVLLTGKGAALSDGDFTGIVMGGVLSSLSIYDNSNNDKDHKGGMSPPQPSALPVTGVGVLSHAGVFAGLKPIDISTKGDGAHDNTAVYLKIPVDPGTDSSGTLIGVGGLTPLTGSFGFQGHAFGQAALKTADPVDANGGTAVAITSSDEPTLRHKVTYPGRTMLMSFGFEGVNNNTGYATRQEVMRRILQWFDDQPVVKVKQTRYRTGLPVQLQATVKTLGHPAQYIWQIGNKELAATGQPTKYRFPHAGTYRIRVQVTDSLGHSAVSSWTTVTVR